MMMNRLRIRPIMWGFLALAGGGIVALGIWTALQGRSRQGGWNERPLEGLQSFGAVPDFSLTERSGKKIELSDLRGKIWITNFIYTSCKDTCPLQSAEMARLQSDLSDRTDVRLVSISVDPERDTPAVLSRYAERFHADPRRWLFLTGEKQVIYRLAQEGFHLSAVPAQSNEEKNDGAFIHSSRFVLVDGQTQIRGYYDSNDADALQRLRQDAKILLRGHRA